MLTFNENKFDYYFYTDENGKTVILEEPSDSLLLDRKYTVSLDERENFSVVMRKNFGPGEIFFYDGWLTQQKNIYVELARSSFNVLEESYLFTPGLKGFFITSEKPGLCPRRKFPCTLKEAINLINRIYYTYSVQVNLDWVKKQRNLELLPAREKVVPFMPEVRKEATSRKDGLEAWALLNTRTTETNVVRPGYAEYPKEAFNLTQNK